MNTSIIITCGYIAKEKREDYDLENERLFAFEKCLLNLKDFDYSKGDEIVISEYGDSSKLKMFAHKSLEGCDFQYIFTKGSGFNQSIAKNAGAEVAKNEILLFINSDVILQKNVFEILRNRFERNPRIFATAARHDVWIEREELTEFIQIINNHSNYVGFSTNLDDPGWHHALKAPRKLIPTLIKALSPQVFQGKLIHDFQAGYINYGEFMAFTKDIWRKYPFDPEITAIVDSFIRDIIFGNEEGFSLELVHDETAVFHLSGSDYMGQENQSSGKYKRLIEDLYKAIDKYECMRHIAALAYFPEFDDLIEKHNIPVKQIFDEYSTPFMKKYAKNKEIASKKYGLSQSSNSLQLVISISSS
jgi:hypothetical protein